MPRLKGFVSDMRGYLTEGEAISYMTRNNPITNPEPGILPSVMRASKNGNTSCRVMLQDPAFPGEPQTKKTKRAPK